MLRLSPIARSILRGVVVGVLVGFGVGCAGSAPYTTGPVKTVDPDRAPIPEPEEIVENMYWDRVDLTVFHQLEKPLNLNWTARRAGRLLGVAGADEADNVNVLDEPPNSSWYTRRHYYERMSAEALARGPNDRDTTGVAAGPAQETWTVVSGKFEGASRGFVIQDARGDRYVIKLDSPRFPELTSTAEVVATKIFYAAGYFVPQNTVTTFTRDQLVIGEGANIRTGNTRRPMQPSDLDDLLAPYREEDPDARIRALASKYVDGRPLGPFEFRGRRKDDPNDRVRHEQRRELRGLGVIGAWLHDTDRRAANTLAVYTDDRYIRHYLLDMGSTLGANAGSPHRPIHGQAYMIDHRKIAKAMVGLGAVRFPWWTYDPTPVYPSVGYYRADVFDPATWVPTYPNPAFEKITRRDGFWGAKIVMGFTDADLKAIVATAEMSDPAAEAHLLEVLQARRDKVGRYWFRQVNPLDRFAVTTPPQVAASAEAASRPPTPLLAFDDLTVTGNLEAAEDRRYRAQWHLDGDPLGSPEWHDAPAVPLAAAGRSLHRHLDAEGRRGDDRVVHVDLVTQRADGTMSPVLRVYVLVNEDEVRVVGEERR